MPEIPNFTGGAAELSNIGTAAEGAAGGVQKLTSSLDVLVNTLSHGIVGYQITRGLTDLLGITEKIDKVLLGSNKNVRELTVSYTAWYFAIKKFEMGISDTIRTVGELNRAMGSLDFTTKQYFSTLLENTFKHGKIWTDTAKDIDQVLTRLRRFTSEDILGKMREPLVTTLLGSPADVRDLETFVVRLGGSLQDFPDLVASMSAGATSAKTPFEEYKGLIFGISEQYHMWGLNVKDVSRQVSLFNQDLATNKMSIRDVGTVLNDVNQLFLNPANYQQRVLFGTALQKNFGTLTRGLSGNQVSQLQGIASEVTGGRTRRFEDLAPMDAQAALYRLQATNPTLGTFLQQRVINEGGGVFANVRNQPMGTQMLMTQQMLGMNFETYEKFRDAQLKVQAPDMAKEKETIRKTAEQTSHEGPIEKSLHVLEAIFDLLKGTIGGGGFAAQLATDVGGIVLGNYLSRKLAGRLGGKLLGGMAGEAAEGGGALMSTVGRTISSTGLPTWTSTATAGAFGQTAGSTLGTAFLTVVLPGLIGIGLGTFAQKWTTPLLNKAADFTVGNLRGAADWINEHDPMRSKSKRSAEDITMARGFSGGGDLMDRLKGGAGNLPHVSNQGASMGIKVEVTVDDKKFNDHISNQYNQISSMQR